MAGTTIEDPVTYTNFLASQKVIAGDECHLLPSTREDDCDFNMDGTLANPIVIKSHSGMEVIEGDVNIRGDYLRFENIEFKYSGWTKREWDDYGSTPPADVPQTKQPELFGVGDELYRCVIHDTMGLGWWVPSVNSKLTECIIFNNGYVETGDKGHGHGIYTQNTSGTKTIERCIIFFNYGWGVKVQGSGVYLGYHFKDCIFFDPSLADDGLGGMAQSLVIGGSEPYTDIIIQDCEFYNRASLAVGSARSMDLGYSGGLDNFQILNNYCVGDTYFSTYPLTNGTVNGNIFYGIGGNYTPWTSGNTIATRPTSGKRSRLIICEAGVRAHLVIYNYDLDNTVDVDCSELLSEGDDYRLTNVQDLFVDIIEGTAGVGGVITVPMTGRTVASPIAAAVTLTSSFPEFGCFILEKI